MTPHGLPGSPGGAPPPAGPGAAPPAGPGVQPPFAAPPIDGDRTRVWVGLGVGAGLLALCCVGGAAGLGGLMVTAVEAINEQARATAKQYLDALVDEDYPAAYRVLCDAEQDRLSPEDLRARFSSDRVTSYRIYQPRVTSTVVVPVDVAFDDGDRGTWRLLLERDSDTDEFEVCGLE
jgi:hypothetical protein